MHNHWIHSTRLAALSLAFLLSSCGGALAQADASPAAYTQSGTQGVSLTWTIENLCFDGQLARAGRAHHPSDTRYAACNDVLGDYEDFAQANDVRANGLIPLAITARPTSRRIRPPIPSFPSVRAGAMGTAPCNKSAGCSPLTKPLRARSIHLFCGIMETPGQLATEDLYVLDIPAPNATTVAHVSVNTEQVKTDRIREVLLTQIGATTNVYVYYDRTGCMNRLFRWISSGPSIRTPSFSIRHTTSRRSYAAMRCRSRPPKLIGQAIRCLCGIWRTISSSPST